MSYKWCFPGYHVNEKINRHQIYRKQKFYVTIGYMMLQILSSKKYDVHFITFYDTLMSMKTFLKLIFAFGLNFLLQHHIFQLFLYSSIFCIFEWSLILGSHHLIKLVEIVSVDFPIFIILFTGLKSNNDCHT